MKIIFAGTPENSALALELVSKTHEVVLVITRPDAEVGRKRILTPSPVARMAKELGLSVMKTNRIREDELAKIKAAGVELALVVAFGSLIPQAALDVMPWWNIHFSLLPKWRGASPLQQSILSGGIGAGVTLFELDAGMDTGPIIASQQIPLGENETTGEALERFTIVGVNLFQQQTGKQKVATPQSGDATFAPMLNRTSARLDLSENALSVHRAVMAFNPEPIAWCELDGNPIRILETRSLGTSTWTENPSKGRVSKSSEKILLECFDGSRLELIIVQPSGKQAMAAADWFRGLSEVVHLA